MKTRKLLAVCAAVVAVSAMSAGSASAKKECSFGPVSASNPGQYFKVVLAYSFGNPVGLNIVQFLDYWWTATNGGNDAETVGDFIKRDC